MKTVVIPRGDRRFDAVANRFEDRGFQVLREGNSPHAAAYLFPLGEKTEGVVSVAENAASGSLLFVGRKDCALHEFAKANGLTAIPLLGDEAYLHSNAWATAQGALASIIQNTPRVLEETDVLILGFGNCGSALARLLRGLRCRVFVHSNPGSMLRAEQEGFSVFPLTKGAEVKFDAIVNTVPAPIFTPEILGLIPSGTALFQIASGLSGLDIIDLEKRGIPFYPLHGLPGIMAHETEADAIYGVMARHLFQLKKESE